MNLRVWGIEILGYFGDERMWDRYAQNTLNTQKF